MTHGIVVDPVFLYEVVHVDVMNLTVVDYRDSVFVPESLVTFLLSFPSTRFRDPLLLLGSMRPTGCLLLLRSFFNHNLLSL